MTASRPTGVLFDVDGTLVDSNYLHIEAWSRAFAAVGAAVPTWRIHRCIGLDAGRLLHELLGADADRLGEKAQHLHAKYYGQHSSELRALPGARALIQWLSGRGVRVVLATSAPSEELKKLRTTLAVDDHLHAVTSADDVDTAKPDPDILHIARERSGCLAEDLVMVGDATWDLLAAQRAGIRGVGVLTGGIGVDELRRAHAVQVHDSVAELQPVLSDLLDLPVPAEPGWGHG